MEMAVLNNDKNSRLITIKIVGIYMALYKPEGRLKVLKQYFMQGMGLSLICEIYSF